ncbi:photosystem II protein PsbQ [Aphanizomenon flos-aquae NRERC-008]|jgi:photosystem II protein PsbQ|uniref:Photosystem II protein PsbQ n=3 Tax=Aphanizomenon flos-aquae TaxID=1176 RepID=A0A1B7X0A1_APHFL|nr:MULTISPECIES: photosystem II protein PsbQ [Aphanizomenon]MBD1217408.1 photosystem II protein PsbQ [Aphanizomenon flos-aquae Clear-A1]MBO1044574.1 photosystem II protein PsbQ [Aphanizomenon flos-aquae UKL13-PB]MBO1061758.1 photosystem II protein PsbQ [Aphanizomenon flos-aquae CP01]MCE2906364.1 photosystem II protein PsbQ [Anabaena sp. CoA2_C59]MDJ0506268.1 photosystem II protein PsbQ [Nostocales cyanobacterium LE14-WE12]NTW20620.1 photosystem II protein PsbQ [Nostocales cyanobacterium W4_Co
MVRQRSILSLIFVLLATFLISCNSPTIATVPPSYTAAEVAKIQEYVPGIQMVRDRSPELQNLITTGEWVKVGNFIHGPMTEARLNMTYIIPNLAKQNQAQARQISKDLLNDLVKIDQAAATGNTSLALNKYQEVFADIDKFLELVPEKTT